MRDYRNVKPRYRPVVFSEQSSLLHPVSPESLRQPIGISPAQHTIMTSNARQGILTGESALPSDNFFPTIDVLSSSTNPTMSLYVSLSLNAARCAGERIRFRGREVSVWVDGRLSTVVGAFVTSGEGIPCTMAADSMRRRRFCVCEGFGSADG